MSEERRADGEAVGSGPAGREVDVRCDRSMRLPLDQAGDELDAVTLQGGRWGASPEFTPPMVTPAPSDLTPPADGGLSGCSLVAAKWAGSPGSEPTSSADLDGRRVSAQQSPGQRVRAYARAKGKLSAAQSGQIGGVMTAMGHTKGHFKRIGRIGGRAGGGRPSARTFDAITGDPRGRRLARGIQKEFEEG